MVYKIIKTWIYPQNYQGSPRCKSHSKCAHSVGTVVPARTCGCTRFSPRAIAITDGNGDPEPSLPFTGVKCDRLDRFM